MSSFFLLSGSKLVAEITSGIRSSVLPMISEVGCLVLFFF